MPVQIEEATTAAGASPVPGGRGCRSGSRPLMVALALMPLVLAIGLPVVGFFRPIWVEVGEFGFAVQRFAPGRWPDGYSHTNGFGITTHVLCVPLGSTRLAMGVYRNGWVKKGEPMVRFPAPYVQ